MAYNSFASGANLNPQQGMGMQQQPFQQQQEFPGGGGQEDIGTKPSVMPQFNAPGAPGPNAPQQPGMAGRPAQQGMRPLSNYNQYALRRPGFMQNAPSWAPQNPLLAQRRPQLSQFQQQPAPTDDPYQSPPIYVPPSM